MDNQIEKVKGYKRRTGGGKLCLNGKCTCGISILVKSNYLILEGKYKRSSLVVEFSNLSMRVSVPGNLGDDELDEILNFLKRRVEHQQTKELAQLHVFYDTLQR